MSRFVNDATGVTFSVDDSKDERYGDGFTAAESESKAPAKRSASSKSSK